MRRALIVALVALSWCRLESAYAQIPAFSGAEGPGATAVGGRGGDVYHVTNLQFDKDGLVPGSLKYGIATAPAGGRTIVFDVGGTIYQNGGGSQYWFRSGASNITIAGQTAPGGITIAGVGTKFTGDNIVVRNLTIRPNKDPVSPTGSTYDGLATQATNSIIDHVSVTWYTDEGISATDAVNNTTVQYSMIGEGLNYNGHSYGSIINTNNDGAPLAYHHNLYAHNSSRNPRLGSETSTGAQTNFYNNVIYNWTSRAGYSALNADSGAQEPSQTNFINNFYARGANNGSTIFLSAGDQTQIYQSGNQYDGVRDADFNEAVPVTWTHFTGTETQLASALPVAGGVIDPVTVGRDRVLAYSGAYWWDRSPIDTRIIGSVSTGTGAIINGVPTAEWDTVLNAPLVSRGAEWDTDGDGMPDTWEAAHGLDPQFSDNNGDFDSDTYTNLEEYLNETAEWPAPRPIVFNGAANNRYAEITNWDIKWQPSEFDEVQINSGVVVVDAVGQHAGSLLLGTTPGSSPTFNITAGWLRVEDEAFGPGNGEFAIGVDDTATATLNLSGGRLRTKLLSKGDAGVFNFTGGALAADVVTFSFVNQGGVISPGNSPGVTHVFGDLTMASGSIFLEIAGTAAEEYDRLIVDGHFSAGGWLEIVLDGFEPVAGDSFDLIDFGTISGSFGMFLPELGPSLAWETSELLTTGEVSVVAAVLDADFDDDGDVDGRDFLIWQRGFGTVVVGGGNGDANGDQVVDADDLAIWQAQYGSPSEVSAAVAVPEPATALLAVVLALAHAVRRR